MKNWAEHISSLTKKAWKTFESTDTPESLQTFQNVFLGKKSEMQVLLKQLKDLSEEERKTYGPQLQMLKSELTEAVAQKQKKLQEEALKQKLEQDWIDVTKRRAWQAGALHPLSIVQRDVERIFTSLGFDIADGPEVETEWFNFDALNIPQAHPARDMQDTFWVSKETNDPRKNTVLRTQTSNVQIHWMQKYGAPLRMIAPGRVYRNEDIDMTHDATFYQVEGMMIDKDISLSHLKGTIQTMLSSLFEREVKIRFRPGYFPFVEPGLEVDMWFEYVDKNGEKQGKWLEFLGAGMTHPEVLRKGGIDPDKYAGFAFGFGLTRLVMMRYGIDDIRLLSSSKKDFLEQFTS